MNLFVSKIVIYLICFIISMLGLRAFDFNRIIKKNRVSEAWILYLVIAFCLTYLLGQFIMSVTYIFN